MHNTAEDIQRLEAKLRDHQKLLAAVGDETRLRLICLLLRGACSGSRVVELARQANLSRPAVSRHLHVLKDAGVVKDRREGTCIYYYLDPEDQEITALAELLDDMLRILRRAPDRQGEQD